MIHDENDTGTSPQEAGVLAAILGGSAEDARTPVSPESRYAGIPLTTIELPIEGSTATQTVAYFRRRFVPQPSNFATLRMSAVNNGERIDQVADRELGDPLAFWKLCDANRIVRPLDLPLADPMRIRVPLPEGVPNPSTT